MVEGISANQYDLGGGVDAIVSWRIATVEELLEMLGVAVLIYGLLTYTVEMRLHRYPSATFIHQPGRCDGGCRTRYVCGGGVVIILVIVGNIVSLSGCLGHTPQYLNSGIRSFDTDVFDDY